MMHHLRHAALDASVVEALFERLVAEGQSPDFEETHISWVILAGDYAYKFKKPIVLDFLDFGTLEKRRFYCDEEIRLNRPWAPEIYIDVVPITLENGQPRFGGAGEPVEYAVRMHRFDTRLRLDAELASGNLCIEDMRELAMTIAERHTHAAAVTAADERERYLICTEQFMRDNFPPLDGHADDDKLERLRVWTERELDANRHLLPRRFDEDRVRICHGDLHLGNIVRLPTGIKTFDCIEFNSDLYHIDVFCDVAFLVMDLVSRERHDLAAHFLNRYLERTGDYAGVVLLDLFFVYRCLVRAKVAAILSQERDDEIGREADLAEVRRYVSMAMRQASKSRPVMVVMHGLSGSGKTWVSHSLMAALPGIRIRSDVERKRMFGLSEREETRSPVDAGIYTPAATEKIYAAMTAMAGDILDAGHNVILDAAFLDAGQRERAFAAASDRDCAVVLLAVEAPDAMLRERITTRAGVDASEARIDVLNHQIESREPLGPLELEHSVVVTNIGPIDADDIVTSIRDLAHSGN